MRKRLTALITAALIAFSCTGAVVFAEDYDDYYDDYDSYYDEDYYDDEISRTIQEYKDKNNTQAQNSDSRIAYPVHDFGYEATNLDAALTSDDYYRSETAYFKDEALVFGAGADNEKFHKAVQQAADETGINIAVFIGGLYRSDGMTEDFAEKSSEKLFGTDWDTNSVFLYLDFEGHSPSYDYIDAYHDAQLYYPNSGFDDRIQEMIDDMYEYLPSSGSTIYKKDVEDAINVFISDIKYYKNKGLAWESSYHNDEKDCYRFVFFGNIIESQIPPYKYFVIFLLIGVVIGILIAVFSSQKIRKEYRFRESPKASAYTSQNRIRFNEATDVFLREHTTSHRIESSSGGGGGGGGGGGSHGGGGGHR